MDLSHFREWLKYKKSLEPDSNDFWGVFKNGVMISNIRVQGNIYHAMDFFFDFFEEYIVVKIDKMSNIPFETSGFEKVEDFYQYLIDYNINHTYLCLV